MAQIFLAALLIAAAVTVVVFHLLEVAEAEAVDPTPSKPVKIDTSRSKSGNLHEVLLARSRSERVVKPWLQKLHQLVDSSSPSVGVEKLMALATRAGFGLRWSARQIILIRWVTLASGIGAGIFAFLALEGWKSWVAMIVCFVIGWKVFEIYLSGRAQARQEKIIGQLPDVADQITLTVDAGLTFEQAIRRSTQTMTGPLAEEFLRFLQDLRVGQSRQRAFKNLIDRVDVPDVTTFVRSIAQAERTGVPISEILRIQSDELRDRRKQRAEERAMKLPVLMLLPLATCVLPVLLLVVMGPAILKMMSGGFG